jgi:hypothetical protein
MNNETVKVWNFFRLWNSNFDFWRQNRIRDAHSIKAFEHYLAWGLSANEILCLRENAKNSNFQYLAKIRISWYKLTHMPRYKCSYPSTQFHTLSKTSCLCRNVFLSYFKIILAKAFMYLSCSKRASNGFYRFIRKLWKCTVGRQSQTDSAAQSISALL